MSLISNEAVTVATTATKLSTERNLKQDIIVQNTSASDVFLGGIGVTTANGIKVIPTASFSYTLYRGADLYGIVASGTAVVRVSRLVVS